MSCDLMNNSKTALLHSSPFKEDTPEGWRLQAGIVIDVDGFGEEGEQVAMVGVVCSVLDYLQVPPHPVHCQ